MPTAATLTFLKNLLFKITFGERCKSFVVDILVYVIFFIQIHLHIPVL